MTNKERHEARYQRRKTKREAKIKQRNDSVGDLSHVFSFNSLYVAGKRCCNSVRWKSSVQSFEAHLFSRTAKAKEALESKEWKPKPYVHFSIFERGKTRYIEAPAIEDRQVHKVLTQKVLWPLYRPSMIYNNGASLPGKGLDFTKNILKQDLRHHIHKYGLTGHVILIDFAQYFPSAPHDELLYRHSKLILNPDLRILADSIVCASPGDRGLPLGVEPSQAEMIAFPSSLDSFIQCQLGLGASGHYMDDYYILVPPGKDPKRVLNLVLGKINQLGLWVKPEKAKIIPFRKGFTFCKARYRFTPTGRILILCDKSTLRRNKRRLKKIASKIKDGKASNGDAWTSFNGMYAHLDKFNEKKKLAALNKFALSLLGFNTYAGFLAKETSDNPSLIAAPLCFSL